jgi:protein-tyrosine phosphatase
VGGGALAQLTAASVDGRLGTRVRKTSQLLLERGLVHLIASDAHEASVRAVGMRSAAEAVGDEALARYLTVDVPAAIVDDGPLPDRPERQTRRGFFRGRSRGGR